MNNIRDVLAENIKKFRYARGWSQAKLAEKAGTSVHYIGILETRVKFPSSGMIHRLAEALGVDPTELFQTEINPEEASIRHQKAAFEDVGAAMKHFIDQYVDKKIRVLEEGNSKDNVENDEK